MQVLNVKCPCCGRPFILPISDECNIIGEAIVADEQEIVRLASDLGVEIGALKGGEKIGD